MRAHAVRTEAGLSDPADSVAHRDVRPASPNDVLRLQQSAGNEAVRRLLRNSPPSNATGSGPSARAIASRLALQRRHPSAPPGPAQDTAARPEGGRPYNPVMAGGRIVDPEMPHGILPFTPPAGWDGEQIARHLSQISTAVDDTADVQCVEVSFLAGLVLRGPGAVRDSIAFYLQVYRTLLGSRAIDPQLRRRATYGTVHLESALQSLESKTMTYADLAQLTTAMFTVTAESTPTTGTSAQEASVLATNEGYASEDMDMTRASRASVASLAAALRPGQHLACGIDNREPGTGEPNHAVRIGRTPQGRLYFYDPWPRRGSQYIPLGPDLAEIADYFTTTTNGEQVARRFDVSARWTPPPD